MPGTMPHQLSRGTDELPYGDGWKRLLDAGHVCRRQWWVSRGNLGENIYESKSENQKHIKYCSQSRMDESNIERDCIHSIAIVNILVSPSKQIQFFSSLDSWKHFPLFYPFFIFRFAIAINIITNIHVSNYNYNCLLLSIFFNTLYFHSCIAFHH